jgi:hypothetical protein
MPSFEELMLASAKQSEVTARAVIDRALQDFGALVAEIPWNADLKEAYARDGAQQALLEAYVTLSGEALARKPDREIRQIIRDRAKLLESGILAFVDVARQ